MDTGCAGCRWVGGSVQSANPHIIIFLISARTLNTNHSSISLPRRVSFSFILEPLNPVACTNFELNCHQKGFPAVMALKLLSCPMNNPHQHSIPRLVAVLRLPPFPSGFGN